MTIEFHRQDRIRFEDCDPAGIAFYPRLVQVVNRTVEDWFSDALGITFADLHGERSAAIPAASLSMTFRAPAHLSEGITCTLAVRRLGRTSVTLAIRLDGASDTIADAELVLVHIRKESLGPTPWPDDLRSRIERFAASAPQAIP